MVPIFSAYPIKKKNRTESSPTREEIGNEFRQAVFDFFDRIRD
jgi:hypothetical protein